MARLQILDFFTSFTTGFPSSIPDGSQLQMLVNQLFSYKSGITAATTTAAQAGATPLQAAINEIQTCATTSNGVMLQIALPGAWQFVINDGAQAAQVYGNVNNPSNGNTSDQIAAHNSSSLAGSTTGVAQASATIALYVCFKLGAWKQFLTA